MSSKLTSSTLAILDGNCFVASGSYAKYSQGFNMKGFPTGGINYLMQNICMRYKDGDDVIVVFDSKSFRKDKYPYYKSTRPKDNKVICQVNAILPLLKKSEVDVFKIDGFEGDDLIWNCVKANIGKYNRINIYTVDYDIACNIDAEDIVRIKGATNVMPEIRRDSFTSIVSKDIEVPFNALLPWKVFYGCNSDNVHAVRRDYADQLFNAFTGFGKQVVNNVGQLSDRSLMDLFFGKIKGSIPKDLADKIEENIELVYPVEITDVNFTSTSREDKEGIRKILSLFSMKKVCRHYLNQPVYELEQRQIDWLYKRASEYKSGEICLLEDIPLNMSAKDDIVIDKDETLSKEFKEKFQRDELVTGGSIGSFS